MLMVFFLWNVMEKFDNDDNLCIQVLIYQTMVTAPVFKYSSIRLWWPLMHPSIYLLNYDDSWCINVVIYLIMMTTYASKYLSIGLWWQLGPVSI